jgi:hypothetical protein
MLLQAPPRAGWQVVCSERQGFVRGFSLSNVSFVRSVDDDSYMYETQILFPLHVLLLTKLVLRLVNEHVHNSVT